MEEREKRKPKKQKVQKRNKNPITYQNKDVSCKLLAEYLVGRDFSAYGIQLPKIKDVRPTNLPAVEVNELKIDNLFLLEDDSYVLIDYESRYTEANKQKYLGYLARLAKKLYNQYRKYVPIRLVIIYTSDVSKGQTKSLLEMGAVRLELTEVFLVDFNEEEIIHRIEEKLCREEDLGETDLMQLVIYPLMFPGKEAKQDAIRQVITISGKIADTTKQKFILKMLLAFTDKFIGEEDARKIKEGAPVRRL